MQVSIDTNSEKDIALLSILAQALSGSTLSSPPAKIKKEEKAAVPAPAEEKPTEKPSTAPAAKAERIDLAMLRVSATELIAKDKAAFKKLLAEFGAENLTKVKESDYEAFYEKLQVA